MSKIITIKNKINTLKTKQAEIIEKLKNLEADYAAALLDAVQKKGISLEALLDEKMEPAIHPIKPAADGGEAKAQTQQGVQQ